jgi:maleate cis-trans isomerase
MPKWVRQLQRDAVGGTIADLDASPGIPVLTSTQVLAWHALRTLGIERRVLGFGQIFSRPGA